jgi:hypothetical protein
MAANDFDKLKTVCDAIPELSYICLGTFIFADSAFDFVWLPNLFVTI